MTRPIYMDSHATTPCDPRVVEAMLPMFTQSYGNAASRQHAFGWEAEALVEQARERVAAMVGAAAEEVIFTSGATESINLALKGAAARAGGGHLIVSAIEHKAVLDCAERLARQGCELTVLPVGPDGLVDPGQLSAALRPGTSLVSIMLANNEIGTLQPVAEIGALCRERKILFHCDAAQAAAWLAIDVEAAGIDLLSLSAHKMYGPKGIGALYVRRGVRLTPILDGGGHEQGLRPGTLDTAGIVGFGMAARLATAERDADRTRVGALRDRLHERIRAGLPGVIVNGSLARRLPNNLNLSFPGLRADALLRVIGPVAAVSSGAACASAHAEPSHVLAALGLSRSLAESSIRYGLHRFTTEGDVDAAAAATCSAAGR